MAVVSTTLISARRESSKPPATAWPEMAAMTGLSRTIRDGPMGPRAPLTRSTGWMEVASPWPVESSWRS